MLFAKAMQGKLHLVLYLCVGLMGPSLWLLFASENGNGWLLACSLGMALCSFVQCGVRRIDRCGSCLKGLPFDGGFGGEERHRLFAAVAALVLALPALCMGLGPFEGVAWFAAGTCLLFVMEFWFALLCRFELPVSILAVSGAGVGAWVAYCVAALVAGALVAPFGIVVSALMSSLLCFTGKGISFDLLLEKPSAVGLPKPNVSFVANVVVVFALLAFYFGVVHSFPEDILEDLSEYYLEACFLGVAVLLLVSVWLLSRAQNWEKGSVIDAAALFFVLALFVLLFCDRNDKVALLAAQWVAGILPPIMLALVAASFVKRGTCDASLFGRAFGAYWLAFALGLIVKSTPFAGTFFEILPHEGIYLLFACMAFLLTYELATAAGFFRENIGAKGSTVVLETDFIDFRCDELAKAHKLSDRETEIIKLLCAGRSRGYIAEALYLSENTVKWYCRQIYRKLDIHKKQELLTLIGL